MQKKRSYLCTVYLVQRAKAKRGGGGGGGRSVREALLTSECEEVDEKDDGRRKNRTIHGLTG